MCILNFDPEWKCLKRYVSVKVALTTLHFPWLGECPLLPRIAQRMERHTHTHTPPDGRKSQG